MLETTYLITFYSKIDEIITIRGELLIIGSNRSIKSPIDGEIARIANKKESLLKIGAKALLPIKMNDVSKYLVYDKLDQTYIIKDKVKYDLKSGKSL